MKMPTYGEDLDAVLVCPSGLPQKGNGAVDLSDAHEKDEQKAQASATNNVIRGRFHVASAG